jgi:hypothetical protein
MASVNHLKELYRLHQWRTFFLDLDAVGLIWGPTQDGLAKTKHIQFLTRSMGVLHDTLTNNAHIRHVKGTLVHRDTDHNFYDVYREWMESKGTTTPIMWIIPDPNFGLYFSPKVKYRACPWFAGLTKTHFIEELLLVNPTEEDWLEMSKRKWTKLNFVVVSGTYTPPTFDYEHLHKLCIGVDNKEGIDLSPFIHLQYIRFESSLKKDTLFPKSVVGIFVEDGIEETFDYRVFLNFEIESIHCGNKLFCDGFVDTVLEWMRNGDIPSLVDFPYQNQHQDRARFENSKIRNRTLVAYHNVWEVYYKFLEKEMKKVEIKGLKKIRLI